MSPPYRSRPPKTPAAAPARPPLNTKDLIAAPAVEADAAADVDLEAFADAAELLNPGAGVMLAVAALLEAL